MGEISKPDRGATPSVSQAAMPRSPSASEREAFRRRGVLCLREVLPVGPVTTLRERCFALLESAEALRDGVWVMNRDDDPWLQVGLLRRLKEIRRLPEYAELCTPELEQTASDLVDGRCLRPMTRSAQILFTPPNAESWSVPTRMWHLDVPRLGELGCPGVQMFTFLDAVESGGGGTLAAAGSHHYLNDRGRVRSSEVRKALGATHPWFAALTGGPAPPGLGEVTVDGDVELEVVEITGEPGDVWLMDLRLLHTVAPNASERPRLMATQRYLLKEAAEALGKSA